MNELKNYTLKSYIDVKGFKLKILKDAICLSKNTLNKKLDNVELFTIKEILDISKFFNIKLDDVLESIIEEIKQNGNKLC